MILFASDFGFTGPYVGQVHAVLARHAPNVPVIDLMHDLPAFRPEAAGCLLRATLRALAPGSVVLAVVDPGVGTDRDPIIVEAGGNRLVGPDNGLLAAAFVDGAAKAWRIDWRPDHLSASFHGRDLFAPVAAMLAQGRPVDRTPVAIADLVRPDREGPLAEIIYCDHYGNAMTGLDAAGLGDDALLEAAGRRFRRARTFADVPAGGALWYANSLGLAELAINCGSAALQHGLAVGMSVTVLQGADPN